MDERTLRPDILSRLERYRPLVDDWRRFEEALRAPLPTCVWASPARTTPEELRGLLAEDGHGPVPLDWRPGAFRLRRADGVGTRWWYLAGLAHVQEEVSMVPVAVLDVRPGQRVLDLCSAPGGKTAEIALRLGNGGTLVANEASMSRMRSLRDTVDRLGLVNVAMCRGDGGSLPAAIGGFDRVLVDAPCSGEGTLRKNRTGRIRIGRGVSLAYRGRQVALLRKAVQLCKPGGRVVYSTCTFAPEENEAVVDTILRQEAGRGLRLVPATIAGLAASPGITTWDGEQFSDTLANAIRIWPHHGDTGGFFVAVLEKHGDDAPPAPEPYVYDDVDPAEWQPAVLARFGISEQALAPYRVHRRSSRGPHLVAADHAAPALPEPESIGVRFLNTRGHFARLTTPGATILGPHATRNVIDLEPGELPAYLGRESFEATSAATTDRVDAGQVVVRFRGHVLGLALRVEGTRSLESHFPKRWAHLD